MRETAALVDAESSECGIPELICRAIAKAPVEAQPFLASQIFLTGGSAKFPGFVERLWRDLRESLPQVASLPSRVLLLQLAYFCITQSVRSLLPHAEQKFLLVLPLLPFSLAGVASKHLQTRRPPVFCLARRKCLGGERRGFSALFHYQTAVL